jgi:NAD(P)-dependent dehydrogenase (short-subunit alcohol dehydrogenase family)
MNKVAIVTGGAKGIGFGSAQRLLEDGATVTIFDVDDTALASAQKEFASYGDRFAAVKVDISSEAQVKSAVTEVGNKHGHIDYLVNSAGVQTYGNAEETTDEIWEKTFGVNVKAMYLTTKYAVPFMRKAKGGSIVNISSVQSLANQKGVVAYAASKGAVNALTRAIAVDYAGEQIRCNAVLPGCVDTPMLRATAQSFKGERSEDDLLHEWGLSHPIGRMASIHDIGNLVGFLCSDKSAIITGASYVIDGGLITQVPVILPE